MLKRYHYIIGGLFRVTDALVVSLAWLASYWARFFLPPFEVRGQLPEFGVYASLVPLIAILWTIVFSAMGVYESGRLRGRKQEVFLMWQSHALALALFLALTFAYDHYRYSRLVMAYFGLLAAFLLASFRVSLRTILRWVRSQGYNLRHVLVVGDGNGLARRRTYRLVSRTRSEIGWPRNARWLAGFSECSRTSEAKECRGQLRRPSRIARQRGSG